MAMLNSGKLQVEKRIYIIVLNPEINLINVKKAAFQQYSEVSTDCNVIDMIFNQLL